MMGTRQHRDLCTNAGCAGLVPECCRRLGKELFGDHAVSLSGPFIWSSGDALSYQKALEYFELLLRISAYPLATTSSNGLVAKHAAAKSARLRALTRNVIMSPKTEPIGNMKKDPDDAQA
ncbi:hypothetical protein V1288_006479 [Bradyrhizobium sp. AZCC 2176]